MKFLFLDTNILLHYVDFEQINWKDIFQGDVTIVMSPKIIEEIDTIKDRDSSSKRKRKAKAIHAKINDVLLDNKVGKVSVITCLDPQDALFDQYSLNKSANDDWFILAAMRFQQENPNAEIIIVSADSGPLIKAKCLALRYHKLEEKYRIQDEPSEEEKRIKQLEKELERETNRKSKPEILFDNNTNVLRVSRPIVEDIEAIVRAKVEEERRKYPHMSKSDVDDALAKWFGGSGLRLASEPDYECVGQYNSDVDEYLKEYEDYIRLKEGYRIISTYLRRINLIVNNMKGSRPTDKMHVFIEFPETAILHSESALKIRHLNPPITPKKNSKREFEKMLQGHKDFSVDFLRGGAIDNRQENYYWDLSRRAKRTYRILEQPGA